jgi:hypothetical protein
MCRNEWSLMMYLHKHICILKINSILQHLEYAGNICRKITQKFSPRLNSTFQVLWHNEHSLNWRWSLDDQCSNQELTKKHTVLNKKYVAIKCLLMWSIISRSGTFKLKFGGREEKKKNQQRRSACVFADISNATCYTIYTYKTCSEHKLWRKDMHFTPSTLSAQILQFSRQINKIKYMWQNPYGSLCTFPNLFFIQ